jgi:hypothetical protein
MIFGEVEVGIGMSQREIVVDDDDILCGHVLHNRL